MSAQGLERIAQRRLGVLEQLDLLVERLILGDELLGQRRDLVLGGLALLVGLSIVATSMIQLPHRLLKLLIEQCSPGLDVRQSANDPIPSIQHEDGYDRRPQNEANQEPDECVKPIDHCPHHKALPNRLRPSVRIQTKTSLPPRPRRTDLL